MSHPAPLPSHDDARKLIALAKDGGELSALAAEWRAIAEMDALLALAAALWAEGSVVDRIVAAKLLTRARIAEDDAIWATLCDWTMGLETEALLPAISAAGARRVSAKPDRLSEIEGWITSQNPLTRAAAIRFAHGFAKAAHPNPDHAAARDRAATWASGMTSDPAAAPKRAAADFLRTLAKHTPKPPPA